MFRARRNVGTWTEALVEGPEPYPAHPHSCKDGPCQSGLQTASEERCSSLYVTDEQRSHRRAGRTRLGTYFRDAVLGGSDPRGSLASGSLWVQTPAGSLASCMGWVRTPRAIGFEWHCPGSRRDRDRCLAMEGWVQTLEGSLASGVGVGPAPRGVTCEWHGVGPDPRVAEFHKKSPGGRNPRGSLASGMGRVWTLDTSFASGCGRVRTPGGSLARGMDRVWTRPGYVAGG
jgi:hypothetical protein